MESLLELAKDPAAWAALGALFAMEVVLGIDNLIFISILTNKLPQHQQQRARVVGIGAALLMRLGLLATVAFIVGLTEPVFTVFDHPLSWRDLILIGGGAFLIWKATREIHYHIAPSPDDHLFEGKRIDTIGFYAAIAQILMLDLVFSIDSIITAVGMTEHLPIMFIAVIAAVVVMLLAAAPLATFIQRNPTIVMLALAFLMMIGLTLVAEGLGNHVPKGYVYSAMAFSALVEGLNMLARRRAQKKGQAATH